MSQHYLSLKYLPVETNSQNSQFQAVNGRNRRMELRFRPDDGYCKPACGDRHQTAGFLLRIRVKKSRREKVEATSRLDNKLGKQTNAHVANENGSSHSDKNQNSTNNGDESVKELTDKITNCSVNNQDSSALNNQNDAEESNKSPTYDRDKYENLSEDTEYELPKLKVLGRVDTEFRFTSMHPSSYFTFQTLK